MLSITEILDSVHLASASVCFTEVKLALCNGTVAFCCCCFDGTGDSYRGGGSAPAMVSVWRSEDKFVELGLSFHLSVSFRG